MFRCSAWQKKLKYHTTTPLYWWPQVDYEMRSLSKSCQSTSTPMLTEGNKIDPEWIFWKIHYFCLRNWSILHGQVTICITHHKDSMRLWYSKPVSTMLSCPVILSINILVLDVMMKRKTIVKNCTLFHFIVAHYRLERLACYVCSWSLS